MAVGLQTLFGRLRSAVSVIALFSLCIFVGGSGRAYGLPSSDLRVLAGMDNFVQTLQSNLGPDVDVGAAKKYTATSQKAASFENKVREEEARGLGPALSVAGRKAGTPRASKYASFVEETRRGTENREASREAVEAIDDDDEGAPQDNDQSLTVSEELEEATPVLGTQVGQPIHSHLGSDEQSPITADSFIQKQDMREEEQVAHEDSGDEDSQKLQKKVHPSDSNELWSDDDKSTAYDSEEENRKWEEFEKAENEKYKEQMSFLQTEGSPKKDSSWDEIHKNAPESSPGFTDLKYIDAVHHAELLEKYPSGSAMYIPNTHESEEEERNYQEKKALNRELRGRDLAFLEEKAARKISNVEEKETSEAMNAELDDSRSEVKSLDSDEMDQDSYETSQRNEAIPTDKPVVTPLSLLQKEVGVDPYTEEGARRLKEREAEDEKSESDEDSSQNLQVSAQMNSGQMSMLEEEERLNKEEEAKRKKEEASEEHNSESEASTVQESDDADSQADSAASATEKKEQKDMSSGQPFPAKAIPRAPVARASFIQISNHVSETPVVEYKEGRNNGVESGGVAEQVLRGATHAEAFDTEATRREGNEKHHSTADAEEQGRLDGVAGIMKTFPHSDLQFVQLHSGITTRVLEQKKKSSMAEMTTSEPPVVMGQTATDWKLWEQLANAEGKTAGTTLEAAKRASHNHSTLASFPHHDSDPNAQRLLSMRRKGYEGDRRKSMSTMQLAAHVSASGRPLELGNDERKGALEGASTEDTASPPIISPNDEDAPSLDSSDSYTTAQSSSSPHSVPNAAKNNTSMPFSHRYGSSPTSHFEPEKESALRDDDDLGNAAQPGSSPLLWEEPTKDQTSQSEADASLNEGAEDASIEEKEHEEASVSKTEKDAMRDIKKHELPKWSAAKDLEKMQHPVAMKEAETKSRHPFQDMLSIAQNKEKGNVRPKLEGEDGKVSSGSTTERWTITGIVLVLCTIFSSLFTVS